MAFGKGSSLKDQLFNLEKVRYIAGLFSAADPTFDAAGFERTIMETLYDLELKARMQLIADVLADHLPQDFNHAATLIEAALPEPLDPEKNDDDFGEFVLGSIGEYIAKFRNQDLSRALEVLRETTKRFSMEFALRPFLVEDRALTMAVLVDWVHDENYHVRRLVSEGTRPSLPWGVKTGQPHHEPVAFLDILHADKTRFVTRSVANHLNDISKIDPEMVLATLNRWHSAGKQDPTELAWITRHALRTLIKQGHPEALEMLGYKRNPDISVSGFAANSIVVTLGDRLGITFQIEAGADENLMVDYAIDFVKANGKTSPKVFKLKKLRLAAGQTVSLQKQHRFLKDSSTFTHYPGEHTISLQINGRKFGALDFTLKRT